MMESRDQENNEESEFLLSEEIYFLDKAIEEINEIQNELESTLDIVRRLSQIYNKPVEDYLLAVAPDAGCSYPEYLTFNIDALINERRQKHDLIAPQQHHKVQEINDGSSSFTPSNEIINHPTEVCGDSELNVDEGGGGDTKSSVEESSDNGNCDLGIWRRHSKIGMERIKLKFKIQSVMVCLKRMTDLSEIRTKKAKNYFFMKENPRVKFGTKNVQFLPRRVSSASCNSRRNSIGPEHITRPSSVTIDKL